MLMFCTPLSLLFHPPGLPKPAILTHERVLQVSRILPMSGVTADDVVYTVLPLYHVMGLVLGVLSCLELGKPFPEDPSNPWGCQTGCQGGAVRVSGLQGLTGYPARWLLTFDERHTAESLGATWTEAGIPR